jgi:hypothetical protein
MGHKLPHGSCRRAGFQRQYTTCYNPQSSTCSLRVINPRFGFERHPWPLQTKMYRSGPHIEASWTTPISEELWQKLAVGQESVVRLVEPEDLSVAGQAPRGEMDSQENEPTVPIFIRSVYLLSHNRAVEPRYAELNVARPPDGDVLHWRLIVKKTPDSPPPEQIANSSKGIGGFIGGMDLMRDVIGLSAPVAYFFATYHCEGTGAVCRILDHSPAYLAGSLWCARLYATGKLPD